MIRKQGYKETFFFCILGGREAFSSFGRYKNGFRYRDDLDLIPLVGRVEFRCHYADLYPRSWELCELKRCPPELRSWSTEEMRPQTLDMSSPTGDLSPGTVRLCKDEL